MADYTPTPQALGATVTRASDGEAPTGAIIGGEVEPAYDAIARLQQLVNPGEGDGSPISITRVLPHIGIPGARCELGAGVNTGRIISNEDPVDILTRCFLEYDVDLPDGCTLTALTLYVDGGSGTGNPLSVGEPIQWQLCYRTLTTGVRTTVTAEILDPSADEAAFEAYHAITATGINHVISRATRRYFVEVAGEYGTGRQDGTTYSGLVATYTISTIDRGR
jgi:hypothetical protein